MSSHKADLKNSLIQFIRKATSSWHVAQEVSEFLKKQGFKDLFEKPGRMLPQRWSLTHGASLAAVIMPKKKLHSLRLFACHVDSPSLKVKPKPLWEKRSMSLMNVEPYGAPILSSWVGRPLALTGAYWTKGKTSIERHLVDASTSCIGVIPHLAVHLDRTVNEKGHQVDPFKDLNVVLSHSKGEMSVEALLGVKDVLFHDLSFSPKEDPIFFGVDHSLLLSPRLDNLTSVFACMKCIENRAADDHVADVFLFYNHEEIGSCTDEGAESRLFAEALHLLLPKDPIEALQCKKNSYILSLDVSHAFHPLHEDTSDPRHSCDLGKGIVLKLSQEMRYSGEGLLSATFIHKMKEAKVPVQLYSGRTGMRSGTTVGPILASALGIPALDIGIGLLGMHASAEVASIDDLQSLMKALSVK